jgi:hypothetical protein
MRSDKPKFAVRFSHSTLYRKEGSTMKRFALMTAVGILLFAGSTASAAVAVRVGPVGVRVGRPAVRRAHVRPVVRPVHVAPRPVVAAPAVAPAPAVAAPAPAVRPAIRAHRLEAWQQIRENRQAALQAVLDRQQAIVDALQAGP